jgi:hypothetical protein
MWDIVSDTNAWVVVLADEIQKDEFVVVFQIWEDTRIVCVCVA